MKNALCLVLLLSLVLTACQQTSKEPVSQKETPATLDFSLVGNQDDMEPRTAINIKTESAKHTIVEQSACQEIEANKYEDYEIPSEAMAACACWWAGSGTNYYVGLEKEEVMVFQQEVGEGIETPKWSMRNLVSIPVGMSIQAVEKINGKPFTINGFEIDGYLAGLVQNWEGGTLEKRLVQFEVKNELPQEEYVQIMGDGGIKSDHPLLRKAGLVVWRSMD